MEPVGKKWIQKWKDEDEEQGMVFFVAGSDAEDEENLVESLKSFAKIKSTTQLAIVDIGAQKVSRVQCQSKSQLPCVYVGGRASVRSYMQLDLCSLSMACKGPYDYSP